MRRNGYILVEALVSVTVLGMSIMGIQRAIHQAIITKGLAQDYTTAQLLAQNTLAELELEYIQFHEMKESEVFPAPYERFAYALEISRVDVPMPDLPSSIPPEERVQLEKRYHGYMPKVSIEVSWSRSGQDRSRVFETLYGPERLWLPPDPEIQNAPPPQ